MFGNKKTSSSPYDIETRECDVFIAGAGPIGCAFARKLAELGHNVLMVDTGAKLSPKPGEHLKNAFIYQRNVDSFASVIRGHLQTLSIPTSDQPVLTLDPAAFSVDLANPDYKGFVMNGQNPDQVPYHNLSGSAATYAVGGMATHWTCACPRHHPTIERTSLLSDAEWNTLYPQAEALLNVHNDQFDNSIRHTVVKEALQEEFTEIKDPYRPQSLPLAVQRRTDNSEFVTWSGADTVLGELANNPNYYQDKSGGVLEIVEQHQLKKVIKNGSATSIDYAVVQNLLEWKEVHVKAKVYIIAAGTVLINQILFNSEIDAPNSGLYLSEQPMAFCQVVMLNDILDKIRQDPRFADRVQQHQQENPHDPIPIPTHDPEPQAWIPVSENRPWHCQIHRDAFAYGDLRPNVDSRVIVDLRWFGIVSQQRDSKVTFSHKFKDTFGMPQPTFEFDMIHEDRNRQHDMMEDMLRAAHCLGGFLPGSEPQFMSPGLTLHIHGTARMGDNPNDSVVDTNSQVWGMDNLFLGGNGLIPRGTASNPTLTSVAFALKAAGYIDSIL
ncbi:pyranose oxidase [Rapidithrix thailandica]|uniref:Pyranose 2-oxidase n=1 Tax=Rapidithrix thailandica TaxID=413964 RepID=A0AAW9S071_9BACT